MGQRVTASMAGRLSTWRMAQGAWPVLVILLSPAGPAMAQPASSSPVAEWRGLDVAVLVERARAADPATRTQAACAMRERRNVPPAGIAALVTLLPDDATVPVAVCEAGNNLDRYGAPRTTSPGREAAHALAEAGTVAFDPVIKALEHTSPVARRNAALGLGMLDDARAVPTLITHLTDQAGPVRAQVAWALGAIDDARAVPPLIARLADSDGEVRAKVVWSLGALDDARAVEPLSRAITDAESKVRRQVAWALGAIGDARAVPALSTALNDEDRQVRRHAAWALGQVGGR